MTRGVITSSLVALILLVAFDERSSLGLVRLRVEQATDAIGTTLDEIDERQMALKAAGGETASPLAQITDEDIEKRTPFAAKIGAVTDPARKLILGSADQAN